MQIFFFVFFPCVLFETRNSCPLEPTLVYFPPVLGFGRPAVLAPDPCSTSLFFFLSPHLSIYTRHCLSHPLVPLIFFFLAIRGLGGLPVPSRSPLSIHFSRPVSLRCLVFYLSLFHMLLLFLCFMPPSGLFFCASKCPCFLYLFFNPHFDPPR